MIAPSSWTFGVLGSLSHQVEWHFPFAEAGQYVFFPYPFHDVVQSVQPQPSFTGRKLVAVSCGLPSPKTSLEHHFEGNATDMCWISSTLAVNPTIQHPPKNCLKWWWRSRRPGPPAVKYCFAENFHSKHYAHFSWSSIVWISELQIWKMSPLSNWRNGKRV